MSISQNTQTEQYAVIAFSDLFGTGYKVQRSEYVADAIADMRGALWVEGVITDMTEDEIELDGYLTIDRKVAMKHGQLTCKAIADCGYVVEYNEYLDRLQENKDSLYAIAVHATSAISSGMVA